MNININTTDQQLTQEIAAGLLTGTGFTFSSSGNCSDQKNKTCTSVDRMHSDTVVGLIDLKNACAGCSTLVISGGTEVGHADGDLSHESGFKADISNSKGNASQLGTFLEKKILAQTGKSPQQNGFYNITIGNNLYIIHPEGDHWDITVTPSGSIISAPPGK